MSDYTDAFWTSRDGLRLHYRNYAASGAPPAGRPPVICIPGLTRNARDYELLAPHIASLGWRVLCVELRGRGDSAYAKDPSTYIPTQYVDDLFMLFEEAGIDRFVAIGTSLGGLLTMALTMIAPDRIAGAVLNDIGPEVDSTGIERIRGYVGQGRSFSTWMHAARALEEVQAENFPDFEVADWLAMAKRGMTVGQNGRVVFDYDMKISEPFAKVETAVPPDLWPSMVAMKGKPFLVVRGEISDILATGTAERMIAEVPGSELVTVPHVGHAPSLDEAVSVAGIERLLSRI